MPGSAREVRSIRYLGPVPLAATGEWALVGQDGGQSIPLGDGQTLFVFSDTLFRQRSHSITAPRGSHDLILANTGGLAGAGDLRAALAGLRYYRDEAGRPCEILPATAEEKVRQLRFWPEHGICAGDRVVLFYLGIQTRDPALAWDFRNLGVGLALLDPATGSCERLQRRGGWRLWKTIADDFHLGVYVLAHEEHLYAFASVRQGVSTSARLARAPLASLTDPDAYEFLHAPGPRWTPHLADALDLGPCAPEYSVSYNSHLGKYLLFYVDEHAKTLMLRTAGALWGPYSPPARVARVPHAERSEFVYLGFEHPGFRREAERQLFLSYSQPHFAANSLLTLRLA
ncbi:MAG: DUF4185 domain-containing protein [Thermoanaerobaculia bacterium]